MNASNNVTPVAQSALSSSSTDTPARDDGNSTSSEDSFIDNSPPMTRKRSAAQAAVSSMLPLPKKVRTETGSPEVVLPLALQPPQLQGDFKQYGITSERMRELMEMDMDKVPWDPAMPQHHYEALKAGMEEKKKRAERKAEAMLGKYKPLFLRPHSEYVLYDPNKPWPQTKDLAKEMPEWICELAVFKIGNQRILAYNPHSGNVQIRSTPPAFVGKTVEYTATGPRLIDPTAKKAATKLPEENDVEDEEDYDEIAVAQPSAKHKKATTTDAAYEKVAQIAREPKAPVAKRGPGRPRKHPLPAKEHHDNTVQGKTAPKVHTKVNVRKEDGDSDEVIVRRDSGVGNQQAVEERVTERQRGSGSESDDYDLEPRR